MGSERFVEAIVLHIYTIGVGGRTPYIFTIRVVQLVSDADLALII